MAAALAACAAGRAGAGQGAAPESMPPIPWWSIAGWSACAALAALVLLRVRWFRAVPRTGPAWPLRAEASMLAFAGSFLLAAAAGTMVSASGEELRGQALQVTAARLAQLAAVAAALAVPAFRTRRAGSAADRGVVHRQPCGIAEGTLMAAAAALLLWPVAQAAGSLAGAAAAWAEGPRPDLGHETLGALAASGPSDPWWWLCVAMAAALGPLAEELVYRGLLQQGLKAAGLGTGAAIAVTSVLFALVHLPVLVPGARASGIATLLVLSAGWGLLYERTGRIAAPVLAHAAFNAANLAIALA